MEQYRNCALTWLASGLLALAFLAPRISHAQDCATNNSNVELSRSPGSAKTVSHEDVLQALTRAQSQDRDGPSAEEDAAVSAQLVDASFRGMVLLGHDDKERALYFDKAANLLVATDGKASFVLDPKAVAAATGKTDNQLYTEDTTMAGVLCRAACWGAAAAGCAAVSCACTAGTIVTIGGFALPCTWAIIASCGMSGAGASECSDWCTQQYG